jgi:hypothetical protein
MNERSRRTIDKIAVQLEASIVEHEVDPATGLATNGLDAVPKSVEIVA